MSPESSDIVWQVNKAFIGPAQNGRRLHVAFNLVLSEAREMHNAHNS